jgi:hypothetical protein
MVLAEQPVINWSQTTYKELCGRFEGETFLGAKTQETERHVRLDHIRWHPE